MQLMSRETGEGGVSPAMADKDVPRSAYKAHPLDVESANPPKLGQDVDARGLRKSGMKLLTSCEARDCAETPQHVRS